MLIINNDVLHFCFIPELVYYQLADLTPILKRLHYTSTINEFNDSFNDLYIEVHRNIHKLKKIENFNSWALIIFKNRHPHKENNQHDITQLQSVDFSYSILKKYDISSALNSLDPIEKTILKKHYYEDKTLKDIQSNLDLSYGYIRIIKFRAIKKLRKKMSRF